MKTVLRLTLVLAMIITAVLVAFSPVAKASDCAEALADLEASLPDAVTVQVQYPTLVTDPSYFPGTAVGGGTSLDGTYNGWCVDTDHIILAGIPYSAFVYSSYEALPAGLIDMPWNLDLVNWVLNQEFVGKLSPGGFGTYNFNDVQRAIWDLIEDNPADGQLGPSWNPNRSAEIVTAAIANGEGFVPCFGDLVAIILDARADNGEQVQTLLIPLLLEAAPAIDLEKLVNGDDADAPTGPTVAVGSDVIFDFIVTNTGNVPLTNVVVTDDVLGPVGTIATLLVGESWVMTVIAPAGSGQHANLGSVTTDQGVSDADPGHYFGRTQFLALTPGYWKNHLDSWAATGHSPTQTLESVFDVPNGLNMDNKTLLQALNFGGGKGVAGAAKILFRAAVAAILNAAHPDLNYQMTEAQIVSAVNDALASNDRATMLSQAAQLDMYNNAGGDILS